MKNIGMKICLAIFCVLALAGFAARADDDELVLKAKLNGFEEVPSHLTNGNGTFRATVAGGAISYTLTFADLTSTAVASHIHFAQRGVSGAVFAFLCGGGGKPACPPAGGTVTGTIIAADILAVPAQGIVAGDFAGALRAIRSGNTYVNVHSTTFPSGEIRGQIRVQED